tara:strand:- start:174 stop:383 length:210 start_codon:yes stop_codon:yes gene_type:complete
MTRSCPFQVTFIANDPQLFPYKKQFFSGVVEGVNNKVNVAMRKSHGFQTFRITELAPSHLLSASFLSQS